MTWQEEAKCRDVDDPNLFYPEKGERSLTKQVVELFCDRCPVRLECTADGMGEDFGVWGGLNERQRRAIKKKAAANRA